MSTFFTTLAALLPGRRLKRYLLILCGHEIDPKATIRPILVHNTRKLKLSANTYIGFGTVVRDLELFSMERGARIGQWNWISAASPLVLNLKNAHASFIMDEESALTSRHYVDATGGVAIGTRATVAGVRSTILTHQIDLRSGTQSVASVHVGRDSLVSSNVKFVPGASVPDESIVAMGAVLTAKQLPQRSLIGGVPGRVLGPANGDGYFNRIDAHIKPLRSFDG